MFVDHAIWSLWRMMGETRVEAFGTLGVFLFVILVVRCCQWLNYVSTLPPGPWGVPFFGFMPFLRADSHVQFAEMAKKYGSVFSAHLGNQLVVVLSDYRAIRDTFRREEFSARPKTEFIKMLDGYGIINADGLMWKEQRRFLHEKLRNFGMTYMRSGKKLMETRIMREVEIFLKGLSLKRGMPFNMSSNLGMSISNVICSIIMGVRFTNGDSKFKRFMDLIEEGFRLFGSIVYVNFIPVIRYMPFLLTIKNKITRNRNEMAEFFQDNIEKHRMTFDKDQIRDLVDAYLLEIDNAKKAGQEMYLFQGRNHDRQMQQILGDLFSAGMETVKTTLEWAVVLMLHHPSALKAVQEELDHIVGRTRMPNLDDLPYLPLTEATIMEVLRRSSIVPLGTAHATTREVRLNGFTIPAGSQVVPLLHAVHMDPELWDEPEEFKPARFITPEGKIHKPEYFMPFGVGRRMCLGDVLAKMELFLFFSSLIHKFDLKLPEGASLPSLKGNTGITVTPDPFEVCLVPRGFDTDFEMSPEQANGPIRNFGSH